AEIGDLDVHARIDDVFAEELAHGVHGLSAGQSSQADATQDGVVDVAFGIDQVGDLAVHILSATCATNVRVHLVERQRRFQISGRYRDREQVVRLQRRGVVPDAVQIRRIALEVNEFLPRGTTAQQKQNTQEVQRCWDTVFF